MKRHIVIICLAFGLVGTSPTAANRDVGGPPGSPRFQRAVQDLKAGRNISAAQAARQLIEHGASTPAPQAVMGLALGRQGLCSHALPHLASAKGTRTYIGFQGSVTHADCLRAAGQGREAWGVRQESMNWNRHDQHVVNTLVSGVEDLVSASAWDEATELAHRAIMTNPSSVVAHTSMARVLLAQGDLSGAELHHWFARLNTPRRTAAMHVNQAGIAEAYGDVIGAAAAWRRARKRNTKDIHIVAQYVGWLRRVGHLDRAMSVIEERRVGAKQSSEMLIESIRVRLERNELEAARMVWGRLANLYPDHPMTVALLKEIDG